MKQEELKTGDIVIIDVEGLRVRDESRGNKPPDTPPGQFEVTGVGTTKVGIKPVTIQRKSVNVPRDWVRKPK